MFRDLKEYQDITRIYQESVNISDEERKINSLISEANFSEEELNFLIENIDEIELFDEDFIIESNVSQELQEGIGKLIAKGIRKFGPKIVKKGKQIATKLEGGAGKTIKDTTKKTVKKGLSKGKELQQRMSKAYDKNIAKKVSGVSGKFSGAVQKVKDIAKKALPLGIAGAVGFGLGKGKSGKGADEAQKKVEKDAAIKKQVDDYVEKRKNPDGIKKIDPKQFDSRGQKSESPKATETETKTETKPKKMHPIEKKNRARFGDAHVDKLKAKQKDFKLMRSKKMSKDDFIKKYPNSITAQRENKLRDHTEWDAYDMVLEYLFSTEQVESLEEANYVMMEMDHQTIGSIVNDVNEFLEEGIGSVRILPALGKMALGAVGVYGVKKGAEKLGTMSGTPKKEKKGGLIKKIKDRTDATNKAIESM